MIIIGESERVVVTVPLATLPSSLAVDSAAHRLYVASTEGHTLAVIDTAAATLVATVPVADANVVALNPATNRIYVAGLRTDTVTVVNGATNTILATVPLPSIQFLPSEGSPGTPGRAAP